MVRLPCPLPGLPERVQAQLESDQKNTVKRKKIMFPFQISIYIYILYVHMYIYICVCVYCLYTYIYIYIQYHPWSFIKNHFRNHISQHFFPFDSSNSSPKPPPCHCRQYRWPPTVPWRQRGLHRWSRRILASRPKNTGCWGRIGAITRDHLWKTWRFSPENWDIKILHLGNPITPILNTPFLWSQWNVEIPYIHHGFV